MRALADRVSDDAVKPDQTEQQGDGRKDADQGQGETGLGHLLANVTTHRTDSVRRPSRAHLLDLSLNGRSERERVCFASHYQGQVEERIAMIWQINLRPALFSETARFDVFSDAYDFVPLLPSGTWTPEQLFADRVFVGPGATGQIGVYDYKR